MMAPHGIKESRNGGQTPTIAAGDGKMEPLSGGGKSILHALIQSDTPLPVHCGGRGACGNCRILFGTGPDPPLTAVEKRHLTQEEIRAGVRLACQVRPENGRRIQIIRPPSITKWRTIDEIELPPPNTAPGKMPESGPYGLSIDLGTTHLRATLWDLTRPVRLAGKTCMNPHTRFGADILQRLDAANRSKAAARRMQRMLAAAVAELVEDLRSEGRLPKGEIGSITAVGNTAMLTLLTGRNQGRLLNPSNWNREIDVQPDDSEALKRAMGFSAGAALHLIPAIAGFVGSDLLAAILFTGMAEKERRTLLVDFGTNSEIVFWNGESFWVSSAAGGPAFDGCGIGCGVPASPGAIFRIRRSVGEPPFVCEVIGNGEPRGLCGSGIVDAIALLVESGALQPSGRFIATPQGNGFRFKSKGIQLELKSRDVDVFQRAKAAIGAGVATVLHQARTAPGAIDRIYVCGAFGRHLNIANAKAIGLLPDLPEDRFVISGNAALGGSERLLAAEQRQTMVDAVKVRVRTVDLAQSTFFADAFAEHLMLRPARRCRC